MIMFLRCLFQVLLHGAIFMLQTKLSPALTSGKFNACSQSSCNNALSSRLCAMENNVCKCVVNNSSACGTLRQQTFVNLTGASNETASQWTCCFCSHNASYCCKNCTNNTAPSEIILPTRYYKVILVFILECDQFLGHEQQLKNSLKQGIASLTSIPSKLVSVKDINCTTGKQPYCGVDVEDIRAHHRAKRLAGGRTRGKSNSKNQNNYGNSYNSYRRTTSLTCNALSANITVSGKNLTVLEKSLDLLRHLLSNNSLLIPLWDERNIYPLFMLSAVDGTSYSLHKAPETETLPSSPTGGLPPIKLDLLPLFFALGSILGLVALCVLWTFLKHSWLLYKRKFTKINSDRVDHKKAQQLQKIMEAMEENDYKSQDNESAFVTTSTGFIRSDSEAMPQQYNWSSPRSLVPAYKATELHNQRTPPKLLLDNGESDIDKHSIDSTSMVNMEDDDNLSDILNSDEERVLRPSGSSHFPQGIGNYGFINDETTPSIEESNKTVLTKYSENKRSKPNSPKLVDGNTSAKLVVNSSEERKGSIISSDFSSNAEENTAFFPLKKGKKSKKHNEKQNRGKKMLSPSNTKNNVRRSSIAPLNEEGSTRKRSATETETTKKSLTLQDAQDGGRRKSIITTDNEVKIVTPKDKYMKEEKKTKAFAFENKTKSDIQDGENSYKSKTKMKDRLVTPVSGRRKSMIPGDGDINSSGKNEVTVNDGLTPPVSTGRRKSLIVDGEDVKCSGRKKTKMNDILSTPISARRKSLLTDGEETASFDGNKRKANKRTAASATKSSLGADEADAKDSGRTKKNEKSALQESTDRESTKRKRKKLKAQKETKRKVDDSDDTSDQEEGISNPPQGFTSLNVIPATPEMQRRKSVTPGDKDAKKKKKKRKDKEKAKRKSEPDSAHSDEDVEDMIKQLTENFVTPETKRRKSLVSEETERKKKKKQKNGTSTRRKSENVSTMQSDEEINDDVTQIARNVKAESLTVKPEKRRKKSLVLKDMEGKSQTTEMETWSNSEHLARLDDGKKSESL